MYILIRLGQFAFPCGASAHETYEMAESAAKAHAKAHGRSLNRKPRKSDGLTQITTGAESMNSYVIVEESVTKDDETHQFA